MKFHKDNFNLIKEDIGIKFLYGIMTHFNILFSGLLPLFSDILCAPAGDLRKLLKNRGHRHGLSVSLVFQLLCCAYPYCRLAATLVILSL